MKDLRTGAFLGTTGLMAGLVPFVVSGPGWRNLAAAAAFSVPAAAPLFFTDRTLGLTMTVLAAGLVLAGSVAGVFLVDGVILRRVLLVRNLQMASAGAVSAVLISGILWARDVLGSDANA